MSLKRRDFIKLSAAGTTIFGLSSFKFLPQDSKGTPLENLKPMTDDVVPISVDERKLRVAKAQRLMKENKIEAIILDAGTSMKYFTGISWWPSERTMVSVIPTKGEVKYISPAFEAERLRELITIGNEVRTWEEDESPYKQIALLLKDYGIRVVKLE